MIINAESRSIAKIEKTNLLFLKKTFSVINKNNEQYKIRTGILLKITEFIYIYYKWNVREPLSL